MTTEIEKIILDKVESLNKKIDDFIATVSKENNEQNERIKAVEMQIHSLQNELTEYKENTNKQFDKRASNVFSVIGAISGVLAIIGALFALFAKVAE